MGVKGLINPSFQLPFKLCGGKMPNLGSPVSDMGYISSNKIPEILISEIPEIMQGKVLQKRKCYTSVFVLPKNRDVQTLFTPAGNRCIWQRAAKCTRICRYYMRNLASIGTIIRSWTAAHVGLQFAQL